MYREMKRKREKESERARIKETERDLVSHSLPYTPWLFCYDIHFQNPTSADHGYFGIHMMSSMKT